jgi:hypothetical protein
MPSLALGSGMKQRVTKGSKAGKAWRGKTPSPKHKAATAVARHSRTSDVALKEQLDQRTRELAEARKLLTESLEQRTATSEVLSGINSQHDHQRRKQQCAHCTTSVIAPWPS